MYNNKNQPFVGPCLITSSSSSYIESKHMCSSSSSSTALEATWEKGMRLWNMASDGPEFKSWLNLNFCLIWSYLTSLMEKAMAPHSSTLAWKIPWMEEPGRLQSMGLLRVGHDWGTSLSLFTFMHWRRKWQPTLVFLPGESQGWGSLVGCHLWGRTELDTTEVT